MSYIITGVLIGTGSALGVVAFSVVLVATLVAASYLIDRL